MDLIKELNKETLANETPRVQIGDTVRVHVKVKEGSRERIQVFEGTVIAKKHGGVEETFTVRRVSYGVGVEKIFPVNSPIIDKVEVVRHGKVRRANCTICAAAWQAAKSRKDSVLIFTDKKEERFCSSFFVLKAYRLSL